MKKIDINSLRVAAPCSASWENMTGDERVRFCERCSHDIYNLAEMTEAEIRALRAKATGKLCGRIYRRADGTVMTKDCPVGLRAYRKRIARFAGAALTAVLGLFSVSFAQSQVKESKKTRLVSAATLNLERLKLQDSKGILTGTVSDVNGAVIPGATVTLYSNDAVFSGERKKKPVPLATVTSDDEGRYRFTGLANEKYKLRAKMKSFADLIVENLEIKENEQVTYYIVLQSAGSTVVGTFSRPMIDTTQPVLMTVLTREMIDRMPKRNLLDQ
jgi:hypothetical protein